ncbi:hypothetical protein E2562_021119 [Oryza meyeriana var. granulata]|uniref:Uncharacterized protein n=1 Tax=Oryza meyeriana var. granulata TaxID=110450 RepID=A0A6G1BNV5_9ORYZ|nr:hypothetical protein E2562_021119 [Oryza meyeriana var. granulata]
MYTSSRDVTRTHIGEAGDLSEPALVALLKVVVGTDDLTRIVLPNEELALFLDPGRVALQMSLTAFDAQGLKEGPRADSEVWTSSGQAEGRAVPEEEDADTWAGSGRITDPELGPSEKPGSAPSDRPTATEASAAATAKAVAVALGAGGDNQWSPPRGAESVPGTTLGGTAFMSRREEASGGSTPFASASSTATPGSRGAWSRVESPQEAFPEVLESARAMVERLQAVAAARREELEGEYSALVEERGWLEVARKLLKVHVRAACAAHERSLSWIEKEREALEEARDAVAAQEEAEGRLELAAQCEQADRHAQELATCKDQVALREQMAGALEEALTKQEKTVLCREADLLLHF